MVCEFIFSCSASELSVTNTFCPFRLLMDLFLSLSMYIRAFWKKQPTSGSILSAQTKNNIRKVFVSQLNWFGIYKCEKLKYRNFNGQTDEWRQCFDSCYVCYVCEFGSVSLSNRSSLATISNAIVILLHSQNQSRHKQSETVTTLKPNSCWSKVAHPLATASNSVHFFRFDFTELLLPRRMAWNEFFQSIININYSISIKIVSNNIFKCPSD